MVRLIKAYSEGGTTIFELATFSFSKKGAKSKALISLLGRRPSQVTALKMVEVEKLPSNGRLHEYRVMVHLDTNENLTAKLKLREAIQALEERL